jgi:hypothetical protein
MLSLTIVYLFVILAAFLASLTSFRDGLSFPLKLFSVLLGLTFLVELAATLCGYLLRKNNSWIYNGFTLVEFWVYGYYYLKLIQVKRLRKFLQIFLVVFPIFWAVTVLMVFGFTTWNSYVIIAGSFFTIFFVVLYYYQLLIDPASPSLRTLPEFWIATGMLVFYLAALPFFGTLNFLLKNHMGVVTILIKVIQILDTVMYAFFCYGFLCRIINIRKSSSS